jgi:hypothetical protein
VISAGGIESKQHEEPRVAHVRSGGQTWLTSHRSRGKSCPRFGFSKNTKVRPPFSFSPHTCLNSVYPCFFPLNPGFLLHSLDPLQACLPACCLKNSHHKIAGRSCQHSSSSSHTLSTANLKILKVGFIFITSSIPLSPDSTWTSHSVPVSSPTMRQSLLKLSGS